MLHEPLKRREDPVETVGTYLESWLWNKQSLRPPTHAAYETHIRRYLVPVLGQLPLDALQPQHVERMYRNLAATEGRALSTASLHRVHATLMSALNTAGRRGLIDRNPERPTTPSRPHAMAHSMLERY